MRKMDSKMDRLCFQLLHIHAIISWELDYLYQSCLASLGSALVGENCRVLFHWVLTYRFPFARMAGNIVSQKTKRG